MQCRAMYHVNARKAKAKTDVQCQQNAEWSVEWRVPFTDGVNRPSRRHLEVCKHHIIQAYTDAMTENAIAGHVYLLGLDQYDDWDTHPVTPAGE